MAGAYSFANFIIVYVRVNGLSTNLNLRKIIVLDRHRNKVTHPIFM